MSEEVEGGDLNPILDAIARAEEISDPLDSLVERSAEDPGAAFDARGYQSSWSPSTRRIARLLKPLRAKAKERGVPGDVA
jgi:MoxR-like ATPase